ncbi:MAG: endolytic transglycosylase MltG, partial [Desulfobulbaceae bacterium]|nr:endolytic transglycosylase MltG [Desulfobulbaceae bacterium]
MHWEISKNSQNVLNQNLPKQNGRPPDRFSLRRFKTFLLWGTSLFLLVPLILSGWIWSYAHSPSTQDSEKIVLIPKGSGVRQIKTILGENGIINDDIRFLILARITDRAGHLRAGEYLIHPGLTPLEILRLIEQGKVLRHQVTIPEGMSTRQIIQILARDNWIKPDRFLALTKDADFIRKIGFNLENLEGYLFPDTYTLTRDTVTEEKLITMMTNRFQVIWNDLEQDLPAGLSRHQAITLASIVEKETGMSDERPLIAQVFLNRLKKKMRLQSDPTVIYGLQENFDGDLTRKDLQQKNPYNTYVIDGLPPGPVCSPGRDSILAVLHPADVPYLYFVSKNDG